MAYDFHYTPTGTGVISGKEVLEQTEDAINDLGNTAISGVQEALDKAEQALTNSENAVDDAQTALNTANNAEGVAIQAQTDVGNLSGTVTNIGNRVTTAEGNITNLQGRMTTAEGNITNLQGRMTTAETNIGNLQTAVSTAQATANSAQQTATTARQQSYVFRYSSTALTASSTNSNALLDNTDNLKVGDKVIDSSGVLFSITAIDTANSTFTVGSALVDLALDANVVHTSGNENISGEKNFQNTSTNYSGIKLEGSRVCYITADNANDSVFPSSVCGFSLLLPDGNKAIHIGQWTSSNNRIFLNKSYPYISFNGSILRNNTYVPTGETNTATLRLMAQLNYADDTNKSVDVRLTQYDSTASALYSNTDNVTSLGGATRRWSKIYGTEYYYGSNNVEFSTKFVTTDTNQTISGNKTFSSINGVEPSSLSLPSGNASDVIDISSYITDLSGNVNNYTAPANGWISIAITGTAISIVSSSWSDSRLRESSGNVRMLYPVLKNETLDISVTGTTLAYARFIPCQGNV